MSELRHSTIALLMLLAVLAGCATAPAASPAAPDATAAAPGATDAPPPPAGGAGTEDPCGLATIEEVSSALGVDVVEAEAQTGDDTTYCNYRTADGTSVMALSFSRGQTFVFDSFKNASDAIPVPGIGDDAVFSSDTLFIKRGDAVVGIQAGQIDVDDTDEIIQLLTEVARAIAGRL